jgi:hypothetical protein
MAVKAKRAQKLANADAIKEREQIRFKNAEKKRIQELERRLHPKSHKDFEALYNGLESECLLN